MAQTSQRPRALKHAPLRESLFELRWQHPDGSRALFEEYEVGLGMLFERVRPAMPERIELFRPTREAFSASPTHALFDRFQPTRREDGKPVFPLKQYGPGVATYNVDGLTYHWPDMRQAIERFWDQLVAIHPNLPARVVSMSLRAIDLFPIPVGQTPREFFTRNFRVQASSAVDQLEPFSLPSGIPSYSCTWPVTGLEGLLTVTALAGSYAGEHGFVLDFSAAASGAEVSKLGLAKLVDRLHTYTGNAFFSLLTEEALDELRGTSPAAE